MSKRVGHISKTCEIKHEEMSRRVGHIITD